MKAPPLLAFDAAQFFQTVEFSERHQHGDFQTAFSRLTESSGVCSLIIEV
jgi:hypothetical protein